METVQQIELHARFSSLSLFSAGRVLPWPRENTAVLAGREAGKSCLSLVSWLATHCGSRFSKEILKTNMSRLRAVNVGRKPPPKCACKRARKCARKLDVLLPHLPFGKTFLRFCLERLTEID